MISKPSKSARKREFQARQALGEQLIALTSEQLGGIGLDERLLEAVVAAQSMRAHGALRRQKQLIGKLMRDVDPEPIQAALDAFGGDSRMAKRVFRETEEWRDRITGPEAGALLALFEYLGHQNEALSADLRDYRSAAGDRDRKQIKRQIFRRIHKEIESKMQNEARTL